MEYATFGQTSLHEFLGDFIVYRNLIPAEGRMPSIGELRDPLGLEAGALPRKAEPAYGRVVAEMLQRARALVAPGRGAGHTIERLIYIGDTHMNDGTAFQNLCAAGGWPGWAFIGRDEPGQPPHMEIAEGLAVANRWSALPAFMRMVEDQGFVLDEGTAMVIDVDKTAIGARGRNDRVIDQARMEAVQQTVAGLLGPRFDRDAFRCAYDELNQSEYHPFTADNQDYLAYTCLVLGTGLHSLEELVRAINRGSVHKFVDLVSLVEDRRSELAESGLAPVHEAVRKNVQTGDPTPFKAFRRQEYLATKDRFGPGAGAGLPTEKLLSQRIVITQEVRATALGLRQRGALVFGVSDKPDEASVPTSAQAEMGMAPLHRLETVAVGQVGGE